jgi:hypothetical protein
MWYSVRIEDEDRIERYQNGHEIYATSANLRSILDAIIP